MSLLSRRVDVRAFRQLLGFCFLLLLTASRADASNFRFDRDTFAFSNETFFEYRDGHPRLREASPGGNHKKRYTCLLYTSPSPRDS